MRKTFMAAALLLSTAPAMAAQKTMPIQFVGDWCYFSQEGNKKSYQLPSWIGEGEHCTKILSVDEYWLHGEGWDLCDPVNVQLTKQVAPSGTAYIAVIEARCHPPGPVTAGNLQTLYFHRYKGDLSVTLWWTRG